MAGLQFNIHICPTADFDAQEFMKKVQTSIDSEKCGLKMISIELKSNQSGEAVYECKVEIRKRKPDIPPYQLIFGGLLAGLQDDPSFESLGLPINKIKYFE